MVQQTSLLRQTSEQEPRATEQYQRFLEASDRLGPHLEGLFRKGFLQIVSSSRDEQVGVHREQAVNQGGLMPPQHATPSNWQDTRLHFVEAMMVLLFDGFGRLSRASFWQALEPSREFGDIGRPAGSTAGIPRRSEGSAEDAGKQSRTGRDRSRPWGRFREEISQHLNSLRLTGAFAATG
jgi:hypothetical protein